MIAPNTSNGKRDFSRPADEYAPTLDKIAELGKTYDRILISDEGIWKISKKRENFWSDLKSDLTDRGLDLKLIVYLRRQDSFVQSMYAQRVKETKNRLHLKNTLPPRLLTGLSISKRSSITFPVSWEKRRLLYAFTKKGNTGEGMDEHTLFSDFSRYFRTDA